MKREVAVLPYHKGASHIDIAYEKRHMDVLLETPYPPPPLKRHALFFSIFILQALRLSVVYKSTKVH